MIGGEIMTMTEMAILIFHIVGNGGTESISQS